MQILHLTVILVSINFHKCWVSDPMLHRHVTPCELAGSVVVCVLKGVSNILSPSSTKPVACTSHLIKMWEIPNAVSCGQCNLCITKHSPASTRQMQSATGPSSPSQKLEAKCFGAQLYPVLPLLLICWGVTWECLQKTSYLNSLNLLIECKSRETRRDKES